MLLTGSKQLVCTRAFCVIDNDQQFSLLFLLLKCIMRIYIKDKRPAVLLSNRTLVCYFLGASLNGEQPVWL